MFEPSNKGGTSGNETQITTAEELKQYLSPEYIGKQLKEAFKSNFDPSEILVGMGNIDVKAMEIAKSFGTGTESMERLKTSLAAARDGVFSLGGGIDTMVKTQQEAASAIGRNVVLTADAQKELYAATRVTGLSVETMVKGFKDVGISALDVGKQMTTITNVARESGVSAQKVSKMVMDNMSYMNQYNFKDGVEGMAKMAAQATMLRIDMKDVMATAEKAFNPEGAIKMAAELQRLGVTQSELLDPLNLMNMAENDPAELQNQIAEMSKQFVQLNEKGQFEILPGAKRQMREIEKSLGMAPGSLSKMALASAEVEEKMKRIKLPEFATDEQKKLLANAAEMKDGVMKIQVDGKEMNLDEALKNVNNKEELDKLIGATEKKDITELAQDQLNVLEEIKIGLAMPKGKTAFALAGTKTGESFIRGVGDKTREAGIKTSEIYGGTTGDLNQWMRKNLDPFAESLKNMSFNDLIAEVPKLIDKFKELTTSVDTTKIKEQLKKFPGAEELLEFDYAQMGETLKKALQDWSVFGDDVLITPEGAIKFNPEDTILAGTGLDVVAKMLEKPNANVEGSPMTEMLAEMNKTKLPTETVTTTPKEGSKEFKIELEVKFPNLPPQIDTAQIVKVLKDQFVVQQLIEKMEQVSSNNNLTKTPK